MTAVGRVEADVGAGPGLLVRKDLPTMPLVNSKPVAGAKAIVPGVRAVRNLTEDSRPSGSTSNEPHGCPDRP